MLANAYLFNHNVYVLYVRIELSRYIVLIIFLFRICKNQLSCYCFSCCVCVYVHFPWKIHEKYIAKMCCVRIASLWQTLSRMIYSFKIGSLLVNSNMQRQRNTFKLQFKPKIECHILWIFTVHWLNDDWTWLLEWTIELISLLLPNTNWIIHWLINFVDCLSSKLNFS